MTDQLQQTTSDIKGIVLDFDGVILDSNHLKADAFRQLFSDFPQHGDEIYQLHMTRGGMARDLKLRTIFKDILSQPFTEDEIKRRGAEFGWLVDGGMMESPFVPGAEEFLRRYSRHYPLFIASGTPQDEMRDHARRRGLAPYFLEVFGSPRKKGRILRDLLSDKVWRARDVLFIGDAIDDLEGAQEAGVPFVGLVQPGNTNPFQGAELVATVENLGDLHRRWPGVLETLKAWAP